MTLALKKIEDEDKLRIEQPLYAKKYALTIDRRLCRGCDVCMLICHANAIKLKPRPKEGGKARPPLVDVDPQKCDYCGMCNVICPFGAVSVTLNDKDFIPVVDKGSFPQLIRDIEVNTSRCDPECKICEEKCPLRIIEVRFEPPDEKDSENGDGRQDSSHKRTIVNIKKDLCPCCRQCEVACPPKVMKVSRFFAGTIKINQEKCPEGCRDCLDVCPVNAIYLGNDGKVSVNEAFCIFCRACANVCPVEGALEVKRTSVQHTPVKSGAWNKALEKLASTTGVDRELSTKRLAKILVAAKNRKL